MQPGIKKIKVVIGERNLLVGGTQRVAIDLLTRLDRNLFDIYLVVLAQSAKRGNFYDLVPPDVKVYKLNLKKFRQLGEWLKLFKILREIKPDVVKSSGFFGNVVFRFPQIFFGYSAIASEHNTLLKRSKLHRLINWLLDRRTYTTIGVSQMVVDELAASGEFSKDKLTVIYNGVDLEAVRKSEAVYRPERNAIRDELGIGRDEKVFLSVNRFIKQKNHPLMIRAFDLLTKRRSDCRLVLVGVGMYMEAARELIQTLRLEGKVLLVGERKDVHRFYAMSDFYLMTSDHEGFSMAALEALAFGLPLISTRVSGTVEYLQDGVNGFFIDSDADEVARVLWHAASLTPAETASFREHAMQTAAHYSLERYAKAHNELFLAAGKKARGELH